MSDSRTPSEIARYAAFRIRRFVELLEPLLSRWQYEELQEALERLQARLEVADRLERQVGVHTLRKTTKRRGRALAKGRG